MSWGKLALRTASHGVVFDGEASPAPGGGSMPQLHKVTVTAAEITAAWDGMNNQAVIPTTFQPDGFYIGMLVGALPDSLPANMDAAVYAAADTIFDFPLSGAQAINATDIAYQAAGGITVPTYGNLATSLGTAQTMPVCDGTEPLVLFVTGDAAPLSGSADLYLVVWPTP